MSVKKFLKNCKATGWLYRRLAKLKLSIITRSKRKKLQKQGVKTIAKVHAILQQKSNRFFVDMGTLLGIVREGRLLGHDLDIDLGIFVDSEEEKKEISDTLTKNGCSLKYQYTADGIGIVEESYTCNKVKFDVNYYVSENSSSICYLLYDDPNNYSPDFMSVVKLSCDRIEEIVPYEWNGMTVNVPKNPEQYLAQRYGEKWRIPDKNYVYWQGPSTTPISERGYRKVHN